MGQIISLINDDEFDENNEQIFKNEQLYHQDNFEKTQRLFYISNLNYKSPQFQNVQVLTCKYNKIFVLYLKELLIPEEEKFEQQKLYWQARNKDIQHPNLIQLHALQTNKVETFCSTFFKISLIFDSIYHNLDEVQNLNKNPFTEEQLWFIIDSLVGALEYLQERDIEHQALSLNNIFVTFNHKNIKLYKISDPQLFDLKPNYEKCLSTGKQDANIYLSPILYKQLHQKVNTPVHNSYKSDVFTLGIIFLGLALGENCQDLYESQGQFNHEKLKNKIYKLSSFLSRELIEVLQKMCEINEDLRPDFRLLDRQLSQYATLFGKRICEIIKVNNLAQLKCKQDLMNEKQIKENEERNRTREREKEEQEKQNILKAIQNQEAIEIIRQSIERTQKLNQQIYASNKKTEMQFFIDAQQSSQKKSFNLNQEPYNYSNYMHQNDSISNMQQSKKQYDLPSTKFQMKIYKENPELEQTVQKYLNKYEVKYDDGSIYVGDMENGKRQNVGILKYQNGNRYEGQWLNNMKHGKGTLYYFDGSIIYQGLWDKDYFHGFGILFNKEFLQDINNPEINYNNFSQVQWYKYEGDFKVGLKSGFGTLYFDQNNLQYYQGEFQNDYIHGTGAFFAKDQSVVTAQWKTNVMERKI